MTTTPIPLAAIIADLDAFDAIDICRDALRDAFETAFPGIPAAGLIDSLCRASSTRDWTPLVDVVIAATRHAVPADEFDEDRIRDAFALIDATVNITETGRIVGRSMEYPGDWSGCYSVAVDVEGFPFGWGYVHDDDDAELIYGVWSYVVGVSDDEIESTCSCGDGE